MYVVITHVLPRAVYDGCLSHQTNMLLASSAAQIRYINLYDCLLISYMCMLSDYACIMYVLTLRTLIIREWAICACICTCVYLMYTGVYIDQVFFPSLAFGIAIHWQVTQQHKAFVVRVTRHRIVTPDASKRDQAWSSVYKPVCVRCHVYHMLW